MTTPDATRFMPTNSGYLMVLRQGDDVFAHLIDLTRSRNIPSASLVGLGFGHATFGFWDAQQRRFNPRRFDNVEIGSLVGSLAWKDGEPLPHLHAVACDSSFAAHGGHLLALEVGTGSMELTITVHGQQLQRRTDAETGANVLELCGAARAAPDAV
ncbi:MAG: DNA-binding protein [Variovorax sp.]|nr:DNA-binding protein [Variovorax sp.]